MGSPYIAERGRDARATVYGREFRKVLVSGDILSKTFDVCVVGAGPAGLAAAIDLQDSRLTTLVLDAGRDARSDDVMSDLTSANIADPDRHASLAIATRPGLGGASRIWGGRCVPLDPLDFGDWADGPSWPISYDDLTPWWSKAAAFLGGDAVIKTPPPGAFAALAHHEAIQSESWGPELDMARRWRARIAAADGPAILLGARVTGFHGSGAHLSEVRVRIGGEDRTARARHVVIAGGGLGSLRLLLTLNREAPGLIAGAQSLGVGYMGHLTGAIANLAPADPADVAAFGCLPQKGGGATRRRIQPRQETIEAEELSNIAFWLDNPPLGDPAHGSGAASAKYLLLRQAGFGRRVLAEGLRASALRGAAPALGPHLRNVAAAPLGAAAGLAVAMVRRATDRHRRPERLLPAGDGWRMHYHAEQGFSCTNRVTLAAARDADGAPRLRIEYGFSEEDVASVVRAHAALDADLRASGAGVLRYLHPQEERARAVLDAARDGYHQIGGAAMSRDSSDGVVDPDCRVHGLENLWVASSAVFPRSGQANPTLTIVALARRLADHIVRLNRRES